jgi:hypothetical protein
MTTRKPAAGKTRAKKLKVKKQTLKDLDPKGKKKVVGGIIRYTQMCGRGAATDTCLCDPATSVMTLCRQITCAPPIP